MTLYLNFRSAAVGGVVVDPYCLRGDGTASPPALVSISDGQLTALVAGKDVLLGTHGFNVNYEYGARSLGRLEPLLQLNGSELFVGILWPGDWWIPAVNYPFEGNTAIKCGDRLAKYCNDVLGTARSLSFVSHSLGGRLILEAVENLDRPARLICLTAAAVNADCLTGDYKGSLEKASMLSNLASRKDTVLQLAYPVGDIIADILHTDHAFGEPALGRGGPLPTTPAHVEPSQIPESLNYNHGCYLPPGAAPPAGNGPWDDVAAYITRAFRGERQTWPPFL